MLIREATFVVVDTETTGTNAETDRLLEVAAVKVRGGLNETEDDFQLRWLTGKHTGQWVPVLAFGPGSISFTGIHDNTEIPRIVARLLDLKDFPASE